MSSCITYAIWLENSSISVISFPFRINYPVTSIFVPSNLPERKFSKVVLPQPILSNIKKWIWRFIKIMFIWLTWRSEDSSEFSWFDASTDIIENMSSIWNCLCFPIGLDYFLFDLDIDFEIIPDDLDLIRDIFILSRGEFIIFRNRNDPCIFIAFIISWQFVFQGICLRVVRSINNRVSHFIRKERSVCMFVCVGVCSWNLLL